MHQGAADNITNLEAKTQYGRPAWNKIFKDIADKHKGWVAVVVDKVLLSPPPPPPPHLVHVLPKWTTVT